MLTRVSRQRHRKPWGCTESGIQQACVRIYRMRVPARYKDCLFSIPNGADTTDKNRMRLVSEGLVSGWPDMGLCLPSGKVLWFELKTPSGVLSSKQVDVHRLLQSLGHKVIIIRTVQQFSDELTTNAKELLLAHDASQA